MATCFAGHPGKFPESARVSGTVRAEQAVRLLLFYLALFKVCRRKRFMWSRNCFPTRNTILTGSLIRISRPKKEDEICFGHCL